MPESKTNIYLVSLKQDNERRNVLSGQFLESFSTFNVIDAVDGKALDAKTYFSYLSNYYLRTKRIMTPTELGCALSHAKALESFLASNASYALIFEDDVIGSDKLLNQAKSITNQLPENGILLLGCQDGLQTRWQYGKHYASPCIFKVSKFSYPYIYRSCAYIVTKKSAQHILDKLKTSALADEWGYLSKDDLVLYFVKLFAHPIQLEKSNIESERAIFNEKLWIKKLLDFKFYIRNVTLLFYIFLAFIWGHERINK